MSGTLLSAIVSIGPRFGAILAGLQSDAEQAVRSAHEAVEYMHGRGPLTERQINVDGNVEVIEIRERLADGLETTESQRRSVELAAQQAETAASVVEALTAQLEQCVANGGDHVNRDEVQQLGHRIQEETKNAVNAGTRAHDLADMTVPRPVQTPEGPPPPESAAPESQAPCVESMRLALDPKLLGIVAGTASVLGVAATLWWGSKPIRVVGAVGACLTPPLEFLCPSALGAAVLP